jgi:molybdopterin-containing oxidoreductase family membrane subunit
MSPALRVAATFAEAESLVAALRGLRAAGIDRLTVYSPIPLHEHEALLPRQGSPIRWYALAAGVAGCVGGFALCIISARFFGLIVGGKPLVSWLPFCVIGFELTVLIAGLATMGTVFLHSRLYPRPLAADYDPRFSVDTFGITVECSEDAREKVADLLREAGAGEVREGRGPAG